MDTRWKNKLMALLHDPPHKCLDIARHEDAARTMQSVAGFTEDEIKAAHAPESVIKKADHFAAAAERFVFPKGKCATTFDGRPGSSFLHPLSSTAYELPDNASNIRDHAGLVEQILQTAIGGIDSEDPRIRFFLYWRRWMENAVTSDKLHARHLAFLPADTRIPDHSIWNHISVTSALAGCADRTGKLAPAMLLFQLGPVQDFIAQARSTRDLWSGSYLLSWLMAHAMKAVSDAIGPDSIIFPNLRGNGIFDALHRESVYAHKFKSGNKPDQTCWERMLDEKRTAGGTTDPLRAERWLLTPTLPNRFLALVPAAEAETLAKAATDAIHTELQAIGEAVWSWISKTASEAGCTDAANWKVRWDAQIAAFPQTAWAIQPWLERNDCIAAFKQLPVNQQADANTPMQRLQDMLDFGEKWLPEEQRDERYYTDKQNKDTLNNPGILWSAHYALVDAKLAARRNTRDFAAWSDVNASGAVKDSLSGKEECIGDEAFWKSLGANHSSIFKGTHRYGAMNLIKRLWCLDEVPYLRDRLGITNTNAFREAMGFDSVQDVAKKNQYKGPYVALLAMDGDEMGKWVSGENTPAFLEQLSHSAAAHLRAILAAKGKSGIHRLLTPSYHLQFSEALSNFSTWLAEPIVREFGGQLIYAGGDDVLAMLPSDRAIACAKTLRAVFRGEQPENQNQLRMAVTQEGYVQESAGYPLVVPGPAADVSIGIAIGHHNAPLQMLVREAQKAEKLAKGRYQRGALAVSVYKRSGEIVHWGCKWNSAALELMKFMETHANGDDAPISGRFPYALAGLLKPYALQGANPEMHDVIRTEFRHIVGQQAAGLPKKCKDKQENQPANDQERLEQLGSMWLTETAAHLEDFINLFLVETFINRLKGE